MGTLSETIVMFRNSDPQLIYDISILNQRSFTLEYVMFNVDDINREDYIAKVLSQDLSQFTKRS